MYNKFKHSNSEIVGVRSSLAATKLKKQKTLVNKIKKLKIKSSKPEYLKRKYDIIIPQMNGINLKRRVNFLKKFDKFENPI